MIKNFILTLVATLVILANFAFAATPETAAPNHGKVLSFTQWKDQQVLEAQNRVARLNNRLTVMKGDPKAASRPLEVEIKGAIQSLEIAREFTIEHYIASYVAQLTSSKEDLKSLAQVLSPAEMAELIYVLANPKTQASTTRLQPFVSTVAKSGPVSL